MGEGVEAGDVAAIECLVPPGEAPIICDPWPGKIAPRSGYDAKFSLPYCLAVLLVDGKLDVDSFAAGPRAELAALAEKVSWSPLEESGFPERFPAVLSLRTVSGGQLEAAVDDVRGGPARPLGPADIEAKFRANATRLLAPAAVDGVVDAVRSLDQAAGTGPLTTALRTLIG